LKLKSDPEFVPKQLKNTYKEFVIEQIIERERKETIDYWKKELDGYKRLEFPGTVGTSGTSARPGNSERPGMRKFYTSDLGKSLLAQLNNVADRYDTSLKHLCFGAYIYMLNMLSYESDIVAGLVTSNRPACEDGEQILGCFLNTVPVRVKIPVSIKWSNYIRMVDKKLKELAKYDRLSLFEIVRITGEEVQNKNPVFDTLFNFVDFHVYKGINQEGFETSGQEHFDSKLSIASQSNTNTLVDFHISISHGGLFVGIYYLNSLISDEMVKKCANFFENILANFTGKQEEWIEKDKLISLEEKQELLYEFNNTRTPFPGSKTIHELFQEQVERTPDHEALVGQIPNPKSQIPNKEEPFGRILNAFGEMHLTYRELSNQSNQLLHILREKGVQPDTIVAIMVERSIEMMVGIFGILKAGGAYLPIDPDYPGERINYMLADSASKILLTRQDYAKEIKFENEIIYISDAINRIPTSHLHLTPAPATSLAYVIYTSGSTGKPKGVMIEHTSVVNRLNWMQRCYPLGKEDVILQKTPIIFDVSVWELFWWSFQGASLCLLEPEGEKNPEVIIQAIEKNKITTMHFVPSMLNAFWEYLEESEEVDLGLRQVFSSGEALREYQVEKFNKLVNKHNRIKLINLYGPTEATVDVSYFNCPTGKNVESQSIPIGKPIDNIQLYVVNKDMELQPIGVVGELCISGVGLARGYLNNPGKTNSKFRVPKNRSYRSYKSYIPQKLYKTGDLARWLPDGNVEFLGRIDHQVKIRGFRIEVGEIEHHLHNHPDIKDAVVTLIENENGGSDLCAYIVSDTDLTSSVPELKEFLSRQLPNYMIPLHFWQTGEIPLTTNGKVDRKTLVSKSQKIDTVGTAVEYAAPENKMEKQVANIWKEVLQIDQVGIFDNFFDVGGHSLNIVKVNIKLRKSFKKDISISDMFKYPTIQSLVKYFSQEGTDQLIPDEEIDESVELLEEAANVLFDDEIN
jgi:surfactin family lipopeptide synthetase A